MRLCQHYGGEPIKRRLSVNRPGAASGTAERLNASNIRRPPSRAHAPLDPTGVPVLYRSALSSWRSLSGLGILLGTLFFCAALTPTLVPRSAVAQGVLSGCAFAAGYGLGVLWRWLWRYLEIPEPSQQTRIPVNLVIELVCLALALFCLSQAAGWQNSIRALMDMEPVTSTHPLQVCLVALLSFVVLLALARLYRALSRWISRRSDRFLPRRVANVIGVALALLLFWSVATDLLGRLAFRALDASFAQYDALLEPEAEQPTSPLKTGSSASLLRWDELGRTGREYIGSAPTAEDIATISGREALEPIRVYVGLRAADTPEERAALALRELIRVDAFERSVLVLVTPTGTGWIDPAAMNSVEYLHHGDIASVALQYSYLNSPLSLLVESDYGTDVARALFSTVYDYWSSLPKDRRPRLYLHGLSLGAMHSERSAELYQMIGDPVDGALWSGPPFESRGWRAITEARNLGSPQWLPEFRDGAFVRFMNQHGLASPPGAEWGPMRLVYLQYASDPIVFFDYRTFYRRPDWTRSPRGPDVSPELRWFPVVTMLQLALDMIVTTPPPPGHGHVYAPRDYIEAWVAVTDVQDWPSESIERVKDHLTQEMAAASAAPSEEAAYENRGG
ncbi:hypothetical protein G7026_18715 [Pseudomonas azotifigens]|uniref:Alpha/beta-hydrolase family protein n=1 Tax=Stutzerimonas azotifigens TaxID=291995 RepID=A0ABR5Z5H1_9GAMM|nr:hypothetical protein [Stutzerimonas azotifigens]